MKANHRKLSDGQPRPVDIARVIEALGLLDQDNYVRGWVNSLQQYYFSAGADRIDLSSYAVGNAPKSKATWIDRNAPIPEYKADRWLVSAELHLSDIGGLLTSIYNNSVFS